jgi:hypothetical protein
VVRGSVEDVPRSRVEKKSHCEKVCQIAWVKSWTYVTTPYEEF